MKMTKRFLVLTLFIIASFIIVACSSTTQAPAEPAAEEPAAEEPAAEEPAAEEPAAEEPADEEMADEEMADEPVALTWLGWSLNAVPDAQADYIGPFTADHPNVSIEIENYPWGEHGTKSMTLAQSGELRDVLQVANVRAAPLDDLGALMDLRPFIEAEDQAFQDFILPGGLIERDGRIIGIAWSATPYAFIYNRAILEEHGLEPPTNFDEYRAVLETLHEADPNTYGSALSLGKENPNVFTWLYMAFYMTQKGGYMLDENGLPAFNNELGVEALEYFKYLIDNELVVPGAEAMLHGTNRELFCGEQTAVTIDGSFMKEICRATNPEIDMGIIHLQDVTGGHSTGGGMWSIAADTEHPDESWAFVKFLSSGDAAKQYFLDSGQAPMMDLYDDPDIQADEFSRVAGEILKDPDTRVMPILPESPELERIFVEEVHRVLLEDKDPQQALDDAAAAWTEIIESANS